MRTPSRARLPLAAVAAAGLLLAGCAGHNTAPQQPSPEPAAPAVVEVDEQQLGRALTTLAFQGGPGATSASGACLVQAMGRHGVSQRALAYLVAADSDDLGTVVAGLRTELPDDAELLLSPGLRGDLDACVTAAVAPGGLDEADVGGAAAIGSGSGPPAATQPPAATEPQTESEPTREPLYEVHEDAAITSPSALAAGLVAVFASYARHEQQARIYLAAGDCLSRHVVNAGFSAQTLRFLAGGPPLGAGSVAEHLLVAEDRSTWASRDFTAGLADCTDHVTADEFAETELPPEVAAIVAADD